MCLVLGDVSDSSISCSCRVFPSFSNMPENWLLQTHAHHPGAKASSCGCCKTNGRECEHGLCLALMANQVCLMSHCCDYQHGALVRLEAPQVKQRGEANICTAGGPQTTLMGFHLLLGQPEPSMPMMFLLERASAGVTSGTLDTQLACLSWHVVHHVFHFEPEFPVQYALSRGCLDSCVLVFFLLMGMVVYAYMSA